MSLRVLLLIAFAFAWPLAAAAQDEMESPAEEPAAEEAAPEEAAPEETAADEPMVEETGEPEPMVEKERSLVAGVLLYLPNRLFDLVDVVRFRGRVGPGFGVGARATRPASAFLGGYASVGVGLPGPRGEPKLPLPLGFDSGGGLQVSAVGDGPEDYGALEFGAMLHVILVGLDVGVDPGEVLDFAAGFLLMDPVGDDF
jgi:hypothetical protein